jgi:uncharacterized protein YkwD
VPRFRAVALRTAIAGSLLLSGLVPATAAAASSEPQMVNAINSARARHGLPPLRLARSLERSAHAFAGRLMRTDVFSHAARIQASPRFRALGEILALHTDRRPRRGTTVRRWLNSPGHRGIILSRAFSRVGAGRAVGRFGRSVATIWVVQFGRY